MRRRWVPHPPKGSLVLWQPHTEEGEHEEQLVQVDFTSVLGIKVVEDREGQVQVLGALQPVKCVQRAQPAT